LTVSMLAWVAGCLAAGWWQAARAMDGNALSYLYAIEWPLFAVAGIVVWWLLLHTAPSTKEEREERRALEASQRLARQSRSSSGPLDVTGLPGSDGQRRDFAGADRPQLRGDG
jgi:lysylphosphatidylglycerol synthetase-like protein (DUF2156 family)